MKKRNFYDFKINSGEFIDKKFEDYMREVVGGGLNCFCEKERINIIKDFLLKNNIEILN
jgi:hypothetical protein